MVPSCYIPRWFIRPQTVKSKLKILVKGSVGVSRDCPNFLVSQIISGMGKATNFEFCTHIHRIDRKKSPLKISGNVAMGIVRDSQKFPGHSYIVCIAWSSLRYLSFLELLCHWCAVASVVVHYKTLLLQKQLFTDETSVCLSVCVCRSVRPCVCLFVSVFVCLCMSICNLASLRCCYVDVATGKYRACWMPTELCSFRDIPAGC